MSAYETAQGTSVLKKHVCVPWVRATAWDFLTGSRHLTQRIGVGGHISQDDQHVQLTLVRQVLGCIPKSAHNSESQHDMWA